MSLESVTQQLKASFESQQFKQCIKLLPVIKVQLAKHNLLVPSDIVNQGDLIITRSILEIGALAAINLLDLEAFEKYFFELKPFYSSKAAIFTSNKSSHENKLVALYLLLLLTKGDISQFHIELLGLPLNETDYYLEFPIQIERWLMEGSYDKVWKLLNNQDGSRDFKEFYLFNEDLNSTLRSEIAKCLNCSYEKLPLANAKNLLFFPNEQKLSQYIKANTNWKTEHGIIYFNNDDDNDDVLFEESDQPVEELNLHELFIRNALGYAKDLETIV